MCEGLAERPHAVGLFQLLGPCDPLTARAGTNLSTKLQLQTLTPSQTKVQNRNKNPTAARQLRRHCDPELAALRAGLTRAGLYPFKT